MTDISAAMGLAALEEIDEVMQLRKHLFSLYEQNLSRYSWFAIYRR